ncbi:YidC/Oxa1 family membrane protein insertase [Streptomyces sp. 3211.6]|uniref:YidC/Oxa1 family membrane protein insertase n=1 Tax=Streptomyces sp. 3211.6 TaxID=1938845 RepID=UPI000EB5668A|nr:YidC/Oxa1 family membrane protein insertase [Streptomyces sp. 3211.6]RKT04879.1 YidC/Oxa1 family membrane protein insertase [Streptomyces sp. 3211.6]
MSVFTHLVAELGRLLEPVLAESATAAAIVLFTLLVRLALFPLGRAAFRAATPGAGCLPMLLQLPVFYLMYRSFSSGDELLGHRLFAAPLGARWSGALEAGGVFGPQGLVFLGLFAAIAVVAAWSAVRGRRAAAAAPVVAPVLPVPPSSVKGAGGAAAAPTAGQLAAMRKLGGVLPLLSFGTLITAAVVPLAAGLYLLTTTAWSVAERAWLQRRAAAGAGSAVDGAVRSSL